MTMLDLIQVTVADVKIAMSIPATDTSMDESIEGKLITRGPLILEDYFTVEEIKSMTPNQRERAKVGLATYIAGEVLNTIGINPSMNSGNSFSIGPISMSGWGGGSSLSNLARIASGLIKAGADILDTLHLANSNPDMIQWSAVGTARRPTVVGGPRL